MKIIRKKVGLLWHFRSEILSYIRLCLNCDEFNDLGYPVAGFYFHVIPELIGVNPCVSKPVLIGFIAGVLQECADEFTNAIAGLINSE